MTSAPLINSVDGDEVLHHKPEEHKVKKNVVCKQEIALCLSVCVCLVCLCVCV